MIFSQCFEFEFVSNTLWVAQSVLLGTEFNDMFVDYVGTCENVN